VGASIAANSDGSFVVHYSFSIDDGAVGTIRGEGIGMWK
jgi:hypothetical protein